VGDILELFFCDRHFCYMTVHFRPQAIVAAQAVKFGTNTSSIRSDAAKLVHRQL
jgi:hypothetical protein